LRSDARNVVFQSSVDGLYAAKRSANASLTSSLMFPKRILFNTLKNLLSAWRCGSSKNSGWKNCQRSDLKTDRPCIGESCIRSLYSTIFKLPKGRGLFNNLENSHNIKLSKSALTIEISSIKRVLNSERSCLFSEKLLKILL
jgi:hypothetical protein